ncbi:ImuA family protein [Rhodovulum steppense]|uniref:Protein ImuA n=1 Tax=Rhodovulum steppense TaxID=540251 RepID=A0A4R1Z367_9RHOB|nr:hypothetical protein [Rhodovulum steppense]TCM88122.1 protein ImuA [Rhodovulum steppense]
MSPNPPLTRAPHRGHPMLTALGEIALPLVRAHELCGPARHMLALVLAGAASGPVIWLRPAWAPGRPYPDRLAERMASGRLILMTRKRAADLLCSMEEALRAGVVPLVVADLPEPPPLTPVRRLHLAAEAGAAIGRCLPLGLILTPGPGGAAGVETRWHMAPCPCPAPGRSEWRLERRRARNAPPAAWRLCETGGRLVLSRAAMD